jgi:hypothetical protein
LDEYMPDPDFLDAADVGRMGNSVMTAPETGRNIDAAGTTKSRR